MGIFDCHRRPEFRLPERAAEVMVLSVSPKMEGDQQVRMDRGSDHATSVERHEPKSRINAVKPQSRLHATSSTDRDELTVEQLGDLGPAGAAARAFGASRPG